MRTLAVAVALLAFAGCMQDSGTAHPGDAPTDGPDDGGPGSGAGGSGGGSGGSGSGTGEAPANGTTVNRTWPDPDAASIRPGVQAVARNQQCTSNFVFTSPLTDRVYLGLAAHCVADAPQTGAQPCGSNVTPFGLGTAVDVEGADRAATLVYSSWLTMQAVGEQSADACDYNDFAVLELHPDDEGKVSPAVLYWGGPTDLAPAGTGGVGGTALTYGNSGTRLGIEALQPRQGTIIGATDWTTTVYFESPGVPGDSGSAVLHGDGSAMGVLVTIGLYPLAGSNGVTSLDSALQYAAQHGYIFELATWEQIEGPGIP